MSAPNRYTGAVMLNSDVGLVTCLRCGCAVFTTATEHHNVNAHGDCNKCGGLGVYTRYPADLGATCKGCNGTGGGK